MLILRVAKIPENSASERIVYHELKALQITICPGRIKNMFSEL